MNTQPFFPAYYPPLPTGHWMPPYQTPYQAPIVPNHLLATPATTVASTPAVTPIIPPMPQLMPQSIPPVAPNVSGTPAWLAGVVNSSFTPHNATYSLPVSNLHTAPTAAPVPTVPQPIPTIVQQPAPVTTSPYLVHLPLPSPIASSVPLALVESDDEDVIIPPTSSTSSKRKHHSKLLIPVHCCGNCLNECRCTKEDPQLIFQCGCSKSKPRSKASSKAPIIVSDDIIYPYMPVNYFPYPEKIYHDQGYVPPPPAWNTPPPPVREKERPWYSFRKPKPFTMHQWAARALGEAPLNPVQALQLYPDGVELHPVLNKAASPVLFNVLEPKTHITLTSGEDWSAVEQHPATSPPLLKMELVTLHNPRPIVVENQHGVTVGQVVDGILSFMRKIVTREESESWPYYKRDIIHHWYWHNRDHVLSGLSQKLLVGDTFEGYTSFQGLLPAPQAKREDHRTRVFPPSVFVVQLGLDGYIPGLKALDEFPY